MRRRRRPADPKGMPNATSLRRGVAAALAFAAVTLAAAVPASAATSTGCTDGAFKVVLPSGRTIGGDTGARVAGPQLPAGSRLLVRGRYVEFSLDPSNFAVYDYAATGAANPQDLTGGRYTPLFAAKVPDLGGRTMDGGDPRGHLSRSNPPPRRRRG